MDEKMSAWKSIEVMYPDEDGYKFQVIAIYPDAVLVKNRMSSMQEVEGFLLFREQEDVNGSKYLEDCSTLDPSFTARLLSRWLATTDPDKLEATVKTLSEEQEHNIRYFLRRTRPENPGFSV